MLKIRYVVVLFLVLGMIVSTANADEIRLSPDDSLAVEVANAESGDIFILEGGATYTLAADNANIDGVEITIRAEEGATERPEIVMSEGHIRFHGSGGALTFSGVNARGEGQNYFITFDPAFSQANYIKIYDSKVMDFPRASIREDGPESGAMVDTVIIENSEFYNFDDDGYRFVHFGSIIGFDYFKMTNTTVSDFTESLIWTETPMTKTVIIENCTIEGMDVPKPSFLAITSAGGSVSISNTIMLNFEKNDASIFGLEGFSTSTIENSRYYNVGSVDYDWTAMNSFEEYEPDFADTVNYDFTLPDDSPLLSAGTDGGPIGDPRWAPGAVDVEDEATVPEDFALHQNYPNPFNPSTTIEFTLQKTADTQLKVYDVTGRLVETLVNTSMDPGTHRVRFDGSTLPAGIYFYQLEAGEFSSVKRMVLLK